MATDGGLGEEWRPWCCPEPRCVPVHTLSGSERPLSHAEPGETFVCFGAAPTVEFVYDGSRHVNDTRSCTYTPLKGVISYQENADDWRALSNAYHLAVSALLRYRDGDEGARNAATVKCQWCYKTADECAARPSGLRCCVDCTHGEADG